MANMYQTGDTVRLTGTFTDSNSTAYDPATVRGKLKSPAEVATTYTYGVDSNVVRSSTGIYYFDAVPDEVGAWWYRIESDNVDAAAEDYFIVRRTEF